MKQVFILVIVAIISLSGNAQEATFHGKITGIDSAQIKKIALKTIGEGDEFYDKMDELFGK